MAGLSTERPSRRLRLLTELDAMLPMRGWG
jgi:hypothetical protein